MDDQSPYQLEIGLACEQANGIETDPMVHAVAAALRFHEIKAARLSVVLTDDEEIADINAEYLGHQGPTDVITFDLNEDDAGPGAPGLDGEIVISVDTAGREAEAHGHSIGAEIALYAVHGILHLLGYDDTDDELAERMHVMEDQILEAVGLGPVYSNRAQPPKDGDGTPNRDDGPLTMD